MNYTIDSYSSLKSQNAFGLKFKLSTLFFVFWCMEISTPTIERFGIIVYPFTNYIRSFSALLIVSLFYYAAMKNRDLLCFSIGKWIAFILLVFFCFYIVFVTFIMGGGYGDNSCAFYLLYWQCGLFASLLYKKLDSFDKFFITLFLISGILGIWMFYAGPETVQAIGFGKIGHLLQQYDDVKSIDNIFFRVFSLFVEHQSFSGFLQLSAFYFRFRYEQKNNKIYPFLSVLSFVFNLLTFSTTGILVISVILVSYIKNLKVLMLLFFSACAFVAYLTTSDMFDVFFHSSSLDKRLYFIENQISLLSLIPQFEPDKEIAMMKFKGTADNIFLWNCLMYGLLYGILNILLFIWFAMTGFLSKKHRKVFLVFCICYACNFFLTNGTLTSVVLHILFPIIVGFLLKWRFSK